MSKTENIFELIDLLRKGPVSVPTIEKVFSVSSPTVYRYIKKLRDLDYEIVTKNDLYQLISEPKENLTIKRLFQRHTQVVSQAVVKKITTGITYGLPGKIHYKKPASRQIKAYKLDLVDLVMIEGRYYVIARDFDDNKVKEFRVDRIEKIDLDHSVHKIQAELFTIVFSLAPGFSAYYDDQFPGATVEKHDEGYLTVTLTVHSLFRAKMLLAPYLDCLQIISPPEFKTYVKDFLAGSLKSVEGT